ncbi:response regulator transcription factor [Microcella frigidaquae]|uniref:DNA-binding response OmpR family regulator n=1 Tax=Microcella frigidaquae TaxID=424758 RepID=A0A840X6H1_9MICO|nr:response regulator transcription factor [Microcella frigidaquae]MBB5617990.1 DNA-binding response OmpR family regulator [Microcella frigidaquae]NHN44297.1 response regulator transcription factor [Microcella frigidaquae]
MHVVVIEDDDAVADGIVDGLSDRSITTTRVATGTEGIAAVASLQPDLVVLDLGLPDMDGTEVCRRLRATSAVPIIIVSARDEEVDRVVALEIGADDYVVKPFGMRELVARIHAVTRRTVQDAAASPPSAESTSRLVVDSRARRVLLDDVEVHLTPREFDVLEYLDSDRGAVFRRADILRDVWDTTWFGTAKTLDAHIAAIRKKLGDPRWIEAVRGVGFKLVEP